MITAAVVAAVTIPVAAFAAGMPAHATGSSGPERVTEDSPGWDCQTMGNRVCGPHAVPNWLEVMPVSKAIKNELHIRGNAVMLVGPNETVIMSADGRDWDS
jgi:hypothetical protein